MSRLAHCSYCFADCLPDCLTDRLLYSRLFYRKMSVLSFTSQLMWKLRGQTPIFLTNPHLWMTGRLSCIKQLGQNNTFPLFAAFVTMRESKIDSGLISSGYVTPSQQHQENGCIITPENNRINTHTSSWIFTWQMSNWK